MKKRGIGRALMATFVIFTVINATNICFADALSDAQKKAKELDEKLSANEAAINSVKKEVEGYYNEINELDSEIAEYTQELDGLQSKVDTINSQVEKYQNELQNSAQLYNSAEDVYTTRLRAIYENGVPSVFDILISSDGIGDFFSKLNVYTSILEYDQSLIGNMKTQKEYADNLRTNIEEGKLALEQLSYDVEKSTNELESVKAQKEKKVNALNSDEKKLLAYDKILKEERDKAQAELRRQEEIARQQYGSNNGYFSDVFIWPTVSSRITCGFGGYAGHYGTDIGVPIGSQVWAAASGKVIVASTVTTDPNGPYRADGKKDHYFSPSTNYGYGNYVVIDNGLDSKGRRIETYYAHLSSVAVSPGQTVVQGQVIGYSGNTGNSYGAHLHFEVQINDVPVNPMSYFN